MNFSRIESRSTMKIYKMMYTGFKYHQARETLTKRFWKNVCREVLNTSMIVERTKPTKCIYSDDVQNVVAE